MVGFLVERIINKIVSREIPHDEEKDAPKQHYWLCH